MLIVLSDEAMELLTIKFLFAILENVANMSLQKNFVLFKASLQVKQNRPRFLRQSWTKFSLHLK